MLTSYPHVVVVVPCYNEATRLPVARFEQFIRSSSINFVFVDDGSTDGTIETIRKIAMMFPDRVEIVSYGKNLGKGEAVRRGISRAFACGANYVGYWDADLATPLEAIHDLLAVLEEHKEFHMAFGARVRLLGRRIERSAVRHYLGRVFATAAATVLGIPIYDTQCGAKLLRVTPEAISLFAEPFSSRWIFDVELIARYIQIVGSVERARGQIFEFPLHIWEDVKGSKVKPRHFFIALLDLWRIYLRYGGRDRKASPV